MPESSPISIIHLGARDSVTGSCHELRLAQGPGILIDCGLFQGDDAPTSSSNPTSAQIDFPVDHIKALIVTHVHIDHVGRIPYLLAAGFKGPIICSEPSALLLPLVLEDAVKIGFTRDRRLVEKFLDHLKQRIIAVPYGKWHEVVKDGEMGLAVKLKPAGHILGSVFVECKIQRGKRPLSLVNGPLLKDYKTNDQGLRTKDDFRITFSGDLGAHYTPLLPAPKPPYRADVLVLESTYGDRRHEGRPERRQRLRAVIERALDDRGVILVPAFSIGRIQELLYELEDIIHRNQGQFAARGLAWEDLEVIVDSPLASRFTDAYRQLRPYWDAEARQRLGRGRHPLSFEQLTTVDSHDDHLHTVAYLKKHRRPCVVIAAGGMCTAGRVVNYLKALIGETSTDLLLVGYQAAGTPGRDIQTYGPRGGYVILDGRRYDIRAKVHTLSGYSAHADQNDLVNFVRRMRHRPQEVRLVHGDPDAKAALADKLAAIGIAVIS